MKNEELIELFSEWINSLPDDTKTLQAAVEAEGTPREAKLMLIGGLSYLLRKIDIVPDYLTGVGVVDDVFVLRIAAAEANLGGAAPEVQALGDSLGPVQEYLGDLYAGLVTFVKGLPEDPVRGRTAAKILDDESVHKQFTRELGDELDSFAPKPITDGDRALREIKSFIKAKLDK
jgi:uncharacterized membrane protein YkvA (DUF1232 family)